MKPLFKRFLSATIVILSTISTATVFGQSPASNSNNDMDRGLCPLKTAINEEIALRTNSQLLKMAQSDTPESLQAEFLNKIDLLGISAAKLSEYKTILSNRTIPSIVSSLTELETVAIYGYTDNTYKILNRTLRNCSPELVDISSYIAVMNSALRKIPDFEGLVFRKATLPSSILALYEPGNIVQEAGFLSTSKKPYDDLHAQNRFTIKSHHGKLISAITIYPDEQEVLFRNGTNFKVISREETDCDQALSISNKERCFLVHLEEMN